MAQDIAEGMVSISVMMMMMVMVVMMMMVMVVMMMMVIWFYNYFLQAYLHSRNIIHRDLNSHNCLLKEVQYKSSIWHISYNIIYF